MVGVNISLSHANHRPHSAATAVRLNDASDDRRNKMDGNIFYFIDHKMWNDVGRFMPGRTFERVKSEYFVGYRIVEHDMRPFSVLCTLDQVEGLYLLEGGFSHIRLKGSELFETKEDAERAFAARR